MLKLTTLFCIFTLIKQTWDKLRIFFYVAYATIGFMFMIVVLDPGKALKDEEGSSEEVEEKEHC